MARKKRILAPTYTQLIEPVYSVIKELGGSAMTVYHDSSVIVTKPDIEHSYRALDFGKAMDGDVLEKVYQENLEERIIFYLAEQSGISLEKAMDVYYNSRLADKIQRGVYGIQYLDYKVLVQILCETEKELLV